MPHMSGRHLFCIVFAVVVSFVIGVLVVIFNIQKGHPVTIGSYVAMVVCSLILISILAYSTAKYCESRGENINDIESSDQQETIVRITTDGYAISVVGRSFGERIIETLKAIIIGTGKRTHV